MKKYENIVYKDLNEYGKIKNDLKGDYIIEIDFSEFTKLSDFDMFLETKIDAPEHYFGGLNRLADLFMQYADFNNPKKVSLLMKNYALLKKLDGAYYKYLLKLLDDSIEFHKKIKKAS